MFHNHPKYLAILLAIALSLSACAQNVPVAEPSPTSLANATTVIEPSGTPTTEIPTVIPTQATPTEIAMVLKTADNRIQVIKASLPLGSPYNPAFTSLDPMGGIAGGIPYVFDFTTFPTVMAVTPDGPVQQAFIENPTYGLAVWPGSEPKLAWGTNLIDPAAPSKLFMSNLDGSQIETLLTEEATGIPVQLVAQRWSADGKSLYFSREPSGIGGYIPFFGASSLYQVDISSKQVTEIIPFDISTAASCLDALSLDFRFVADHCTQYVITVRELSSGETTTIQPPDGLASYRLLGSARFSPDGSRVAFALAAGNPDAEQGWVAVSDSLQGSSMLVISGEPGVAYTVIGWLNDQTLLVQSGSNPGGASADSQLWTVNVDGSNLVKVADGRFLVQVDDR